MLYQFGPFVQFEILPLNVNQVDHVTGSEWARKEIAGAQMYREWVGESDEELTLRGRLHPHWVARHRGSQQTEGGGFFALERLDNVRRLGQAHVLMRGDGWKMGWYIIERLARGHTLLGVDGIGQQVDFQATFQRVPVPDPNSYFSSLWGAGGGGASP